MNLPPSRRDMVNDHTNGYHRTEAKTFCPACNVECPRCGDMLMYRNSCHEAGVIPGSVSADERKRQERAFRERVGL